MGRVTAGIRSTVGVDGLLIESEYDDEGGEREEIWACETFVEENDNLFNSFIIVLVVS